MFYCFALGNFFAVRARWPDCTAAWPCWTSLPPKIPTRSLVSSTYLLSVTSLWNTCSFCQISCWLHPYLVSANKSCTKAHLSSPMLFPMLNIPFLFFLQMAPLVLVLFCWPSQCFTTLRAKAALPQTCFIRATLNPSGNGWQWLSPVPCIKERKVYWSSQSKSAASYRSALPASAWCNTVCLHTHQLINHSCNLVTFTECTWTVYIWGVPCDRVKG